MGYERSMSFLVIPKSLKLRKSDWAILRVLWPLSRFTQFLPLSDFTWIVKTYNLSKAHCTVLFFKISFPFHLRNHHSKVVNSLFGLSSYFSHNSCQSLQLKYIPLASIWNLPGYGNHICFNATSKSLKKVLEIGLVSFKRCHVAMSRACTPNWLTVSLHVPPKNT